jgi:hypothetical protein
MWRLITRYRAYLISKALPLSGVALSMEARAQVIPWMFIPLIVMGLCWVFDASERFKSWAIGSSCALAVGGFSIVFWEFFVVPLKNDVKRGLGKPDSDLD